MRVSEFVQACSDALFFEIEEEFQRAHEKHDGWTPAHHMMEVGQKLAILMEEVGEVARAVTYDEGDKENLKKELVQVATMALAWRASLD